MPFVEFRRKFLCLIKCLKLAVQCTLSPNIKQQNDDNLIDLINAVAYKRYGQTWAGDLLTKFEN